LLIDLPMEVCTPRLLLRVPRAGDGVIVLEAIAESLPRLRRFLGSLPWVAGEQTAETAEAFCRQGQADFLGRRNLPFLVFDRASDRLVASVGLYRPHWDIPKTEIGYWCRTSCTGQGYVTEAVSVLLDYAFTHMKAVRVELITDEDNLASRRVAARCGFMLEGILRNTCVYARHPG
jgi:RimJ/RimL family protein N-acetyltransferase